MKSIKQILAEKNRPLITATPDQTVFDTARLMQEKDIGAVMVVEDERLIGIFTERDCLHKITAEGRNPKEICIRDVMTEKVRFITPEMAVAQGLALMTERFFRHLPVLDEQQKILGIVSIGDLVKAKLSEQDFLIEQLEHYIAS